MLGILVTREVKKNAVFVGHVSFVKMKFFTYSYGNQIPKFCVTFNLSEMVGLIYPSLALSEIHLPCLEIKRSLVLFVALIEAPPALSPCKPRF